MDDIKILMAENKNRENILLTAQSFGFEITLRHRKMPLVLTILLHKKPTVRNQLASTVHRWLRPGKANIKINLLCTDATMAKNGLNFFEQSKPYL